MAGRDSNVTYYTKSDTAANTKTAERAAKRSYTNPVLSVSRNEENDINAEGMTGDWWNTGVRHRNRSVSFPLEGVERPSFADEGKESAASYIDTNSLSFLPDTLSSWSTTFQNSGWLDIYLNTTATRSLQ